MQRRHACYTYQFKGSRLPYYMQSWPEQTTQPACERSERMQGVRVLRSIQHANCHFGGPHLAPQVCLLYDHNIRYPSHDALSCSQAEELGFTISPTCRSPFSTLPWCTTSAPPPALCASSINTTAESEVDASAPLLLLLLPA